MASSATPEFGQAQSGCVYWERSGAYALMLSPDGLLAVVEGREGRLYLPGGGYGEGETGEEALLREAKEEGGWQIEIGPHFAEAIQYVEAGAEGDFRLHARYYRARIIAENIGVAEHRVAWLTLDEAAARLHRACDRWAVGRPAEVPLG